MSAPVLTALGAALARGALSGGPLATPQAVPPLPPGAPVGDGTVTATQVLLGAYDLSAIALAIVVAAALIGLARGARRELVTLVITLVLAFAIGRAWGLLAWALTTVWNVAASLIPGGLLSPMAIPADGAGSWQVATFLVAVVVLAYGGSRMVASGVAPGVSVASILERVIGAGLGAMTGHTVARFVLARALPGAVVSPFSAGSQLAERVQALGPRAALGIMLLVLVLGALSIGAVDRGPRQKVYN